MLQVGLDNSCKLQAVEVTYYCDCGCSINDETVSSIMYYADNGKFTLYHALMISHRYILYFTGNEHLSELINVLNEIFVK
jgi:xanthine dehydrogenase molybdopterin-binding subunit B